MRIGEWDCDEVCEGCEKQNDPAWCLVAIAELTEEILKGRRGFPLTQGESHDLA